MWEAVASMLELRMGAGAGVAAGQLFVCGGSPIHNPAPAASHWTEFYDPATGRWEPDVSMIRARFLPGVVPMGPGRF